MEPGRPDQTIEHRSGLAAWCEANVDGFRGPLKVTMFAVGQSNPTYLLQAPSGRYVLRRKPPGVLLKSAHAVDREYRVMGALAHTDIPVPRVHALCEDDAVIGTMFFVMEHIEGRTFLDPALPQLGASQRRSLYRQQVELLAKLSRLDPAALGLADFGKPGDYVERQLRRWSAQYRATETETIPAMERLMDWLPRHIPADDGRGALVHGDFRLDNLLIHPTRMEIVGVIDWELSTLGHPFVDFSYWSTMLRLPRDTYHKGLEGCDRESRGIPPERSMIDLYCRLSRSTVPGGWPFWIAFHGFRFAAIAQGVMKRHLEGNASSPSAREVGLMAGPAAELGWQAASECASASRP